MDTQYKRTDLGKVFITLLRNNSIFPLNLEHTRQEFLANIEVIGLPISFRFNYNVSTSHEHYIFETDNWKVEMETPLSYKPLQIVTTDDLERFKKDICLIKMALS